MYCGSKSLFCSPKLGYADMRRNINRNVSTQTEQGSQLDLLKFLLFSENFMTNENSVNVYNLLLNYINSFHHLLNEKIANCLMENGKYNTFKIPDIPNYLNLYDVMSSKNDEKTSRTRGEQLILKDVKSKGTYSLNVALNSQISHEVIEKKLELFKGSEHYTNLELLKNEVGQEMTEFVNTANTPENNSFNGSNYSGETREDECITFSKFQDEVCVKTNSNMQHVENKISITGITKSRQFLKDNIEESRKSISSIFNVIDIKTRNDIPEKTFDLETSSDPSASDSQQHDLFSENTNHVSKEKKRNKVRPDKPFKVLQMFDKISSRNMLENQTSVLQENIVASNYSSEMKNSLEEDSCALSESSSDILDDDEFELMNHNRSNKTDVLLFQNKVTENLSGINQEKSHPLQLSEKDLPNLNTQMIKAIGLFTDKGDIKPTVLNILQMKKHSKVDDQKTQHFRNKRPLNVRLNMKATTARNSSLTSLSSDKFC